MESYNAQNEDVLVHLRREFNLNYQFEHSINVNLITRVPQIFVEIRNVEIPAKQFSIQEGLTIPMIKTQPMLLSNENQYIPLSNLPSYISPSNSPSSLFSSSSTDDLVIAPDTSNYQFDHNMIKFGKQEKSFDISTMVDLSQKDAAKKLGIPGSTLSKKWREATGNRKWPFRTIQKLDHRIHTLFHNHVNAGNKDGSMTKETTVLLEHLLFQRKKETSPVFVKL